MTSYALLPKNAKFGTGISYHPVWVLKHYGHSLQWPWH